jgi:hypothetical protein
MNTLNAKTTASVHAKSVRITANTLQVRLDDGREINLPFREISWLKWLAKATPKQRANWTLEPGGFAIYWPDLDDGVEVCHLLDSQPISRAGEAKNE